WDVDRGVVAELMRERLAHALVVADQAGDLRPDLVEPLGGQLVQHGFVEVPADRVEVPLDDADEQRDRVFRRARQDRLCHGLSRSWIDGPAEPLEGGLPGGAEYVP